MLLAFIPIIKKISPSLIIVGIIFFVGCYVGYKFESSATQAARLALATQQKADAQAAADANALAAADLVQANARANSAQGRLAHENLQAGSWETTLTSQIAAQAVLPGQDAPDAPVLSATLDALAKGQP